MWQYSSRPAGQKMRDKYSQTTAVGGWNRDEQIAAVFAGVFGDAPGGEESAAQRGEIIAEALNVHEQTGLTPAQLSADLAAAQQEIARLRAALDEIGGLSRHLRNGGPDESDLEELSDGLENAVRIAIGALEQTK